MKKIELCHKKGKWRKGPKGVPVFLHARHCCKKGKPMDQMII